jgi:hypothetical protein
MFNWHLISGVVAGVLIVSAIIPYIRDILYGTTRPNVFSFGIWAFLLFISILAQLSAGSSWSVLLVAGDFLVTTTIAILCFVGYGYKKYGWLERVCFVLAIVAIISWQATNEPVLAIIFAIVADALAALPTVVKAYRDPWSEAPTMWLIVSLAALFGILSTTIIDAANLLFPIYILFINGLIGLLAFFGRRSRPKSL